jgi:SAM-dependent methyltransferase
MLLCTGKDGYVPSADFERRTAVNMRDAKTGDVEVLQSERYAYDVVDTEGYEDKFEVLLAQLPPGKCRRYLEVGCGYGRWFPIIAKMDGAFESYVGVDACYDRVRHASWLHENDPRARFSWLDAAGTEAGLGQKFDVVFICTVIQHLRLDEKARLVEFAVRHVNEGGALIMFEGKVLDVSLGECEKRYADASCPAHMIPTPFVHLRIWSKPLALERLGPEHFIAKRENE